MYREDKIPTVIAAGANYCSHLPSAVEMEMRDQQRLPLLPVQTGY